MYTHGPSMHFNTHTHYTHTCTISYIYKDRERRRRVGRTVQYRIDLIKIYSYIADYIIEEVITFR